MDAKDQVEILMKEYDTLRAEILQRASHRFTLLSLAGAICAYAFFFAGNLGRVQEIALLVGGTLLLGIWLELGNVMARCSGLLGSQLLASV